jgi:hypothetical protein
LATARIDSIRVTLSSQSPLLTASELLGVPGDILVSTKASSVAPN